MWKSGLSAMAKLDYFFPVLLLLLFVESQVVSAQGWYSLNIFFLKFFRW